MYTIIHDAFFFVKCDLATDSALYSNSNLHKVRIYGKVCGYREI